MTTKGNVGCMVEYAGDGVKNLSVQERATITNMGAELGVTTSVFPQRRTNQRISQITGTRRLLRAFMRRRRRRIF